MISHKHECIFIHIHKCAGSSIERALGLYEESFRGAQDHRKLIAIERLANRMFRIRKLFVHILTFNSKEVKKDINKIFKPEITINQFRNYFKFAIVRNTYERLYSWYCGVLKDDIIREEFGLPENFTFEQFITHPRLRPDTFGQLSFLRLSNGEIGVDQIIKFDELNTEIPMLFTKLGVSSKLQKSHSRSVGSYKEYLSESDINLIREIYKEEIEFFDFK